MTHYDDLTNNSTLGTNGRYLVKSKKKEDALNASKQVWEGGLIIVVEYEGTNYVKITDGANTFVSLASEGGSPSVTSGEISDATTVGKAVLTASNATNARNAIGAASITDLNAKAPINNPTFTGTVGGITKNMVGLSNVDNTTDLQKPISTATQTALDIKASLLQNNSKIVQFGDSITAYGNNTGNPYFDSWGFTTWLNIYTGGRLLLPSGGNKGVGGNTTVQMIARLGAALALNPAVVTFIGGTNDIAVLGSPAATIQANIKTIVDAFTSINAVVVIGTILPRYGTSALTAPQEVIRQSVNAYILTLAGDKVKVVNNETNMTGAGLYQSDGLHPATNGAQILGANMANPIIGLLPTFRITDSVAQDNALTTNIALTGTSGSVNGATGQVATSYTLNASNSGGATVVGSKTSTGTYNQQVITISGNKTLTNKLIQFGTSSFATAALTTGSITNSFLDYEILTPLVNVKGIAISTNYNGAGGYLADSYSYFPIDAVVPSYPVGRYQLRGYNFVAPASVTNVDMFVTIFLNDGSVAVSGSIKIWKAAVQKIS